MKTTFTTRFAVALVALVGLVVAALQLTNAGAAVSEAAHGESSRPDRTTLARQTDDDDGDDGLTESDLDSDDEEVTLTLLHNNDGESKLLPDADGGFPGVARFAQSWIERGKASDSDILLRVSSGDNFLASKEFAAGLEREDEPLYDSIALRGLYEAMAFGNHDFDFGPEVTARFIEGFEQSGSTEPVPFVATNVDVSDEPSLQALVEAGRIAPSVVFTDPDSGFDIGIVGALTPRLSNISSPRDVIVDADVAGAINDEVARLEARGVDRIVLVSHLQGLGEDRDLVPQLVGVDIVVAGGGDELLKNDGDSCQPDEDAAGSYPLFLTDAEGSDIPVVTTPGGYRCYGALEVTFDSDGVVIEVSGESIGVDLDGDPENFALTRVEEPLADALADLDGTVIGSSDVDLDGRRSSVRTGASNVGELLADAILAAGQAAPEFGGERPDVAVQNGGGIRNDSVLGAGDITEADTFDIAPFANFVVAGEISREQFKDMLELGVSGLPEAEGTFPQIAGFTMIIDADEPGREVDSEGDCSLTGDEGSRVREVTLDDGTEIITDGEVVDGDDIVLATIDFLANGGDCYPLADADFVKVGVSYQQALSTFIADDLDGEISEDDYPQDGSRIETLGQGSSNASAAQTDDDDPTDDDDDDDADDDSNGESDDADDADNGGSDDDADSDEDADSDQDEDEDAAATSADDDDSDELPNTGLESTLWLVVALTVLAGGALIAIEAHRAGRLSLTNRLFATRAWDPDEWRSENDAE